MGILQKMIDMEKVIRIIDELIFEAQKEPAWKSENALKCLKKELLKGQEPVEPILDSFLHKRCPSCKTLLKGRFCHECGKAVKWE
jgi:hypothetical protein